MANSPNINISLDFDTFKKLLEIVDASGPELDPLRTILMDKLQRMVNHDLYTSYKTATSESDREAARLKYLESRGIPKNFRW